jgi:hypothetical protein
MDEDEVLSAIQHTAIRCFFNLFEDSSVLLTSVNAEDGNFTELPDKW